MKTEIKTVNSNTREFIVTLENEEAKKDFQKVFNKVKKNLEIPGFRKGKVPQSYIEKNYMDYIKEEYFDQYAEVYYKEALKDATVRPITAGQIKEVKWDTDQECIFTYQFQCFPDDFEPVYKNIEVEYAEPTYDMETQVNKAIEELLKNNAEEIPFEENDEIAEKDLVTLEFFNNESVPGCYQENETFIFEAGTKKYGATLDQQILGLKINSVFTGTLLDAEQQIQGDYQFKVTDAFKVKLPELTEQFAKENDFDSIEDLKNKLREDFQKEFETVKNREIEQAIVRAVAKANPLDIPEEFYISNAKYMFSKNYNIPVDHLDQETLLKFGKMFTESQTIFDLVLEKVKKIENLEATEEDKNAYIELLIKDQNQTIEEYKENYKHFVDTENFTDQVLQFKLVNMIKETMTIVEPKPPVPEENDEPGIEEAVFETVTE